MIKRYENESYLTVCETVVTTLEEESDGNYIRLGETIFFPEEGGQYADSGKIYFDGGEATVLDGIFKKGDIRYKVDVPIPMGTQVMCELDWSKRYMRMQQHSGEHIMVGLIHNLYGYDNVGFHLSDTAPVTMDVNGPLDAEQVKLVETLANEAVFKNLPITMTYPTKEELPNLTYRSKIEIEGQVRLVHIGEGKEKLDCCACCAPHVARTGEIGMIKVIDFQKYKGGTRISVLCGMRALEYVREQQMIITGLSRLLSVPAEKLEATAAGLKTEIGELKYQVAKEKEQKVVSEIEALEAGKHLCVITEAVLDAATLKNCFNMLAEKAEGYAAVFTGNDTDGYRYNAGSRSLDSRELAKKMRAALDAKGGGSAEMIQGKAGASREQIERYFKEELA